MILALLLGALALPTSAPKSYALSTSHRPAIADDQAEYEKRKKEASGKADKLWELYTWCDAHGMAKESQATLRSIIKLAPDDKKAHELLGEVFYDGKWFADQAKADAYKQKQGAPAKAEPTKAEPAKPAADSPDAALVARGLVKTADGEWLTADEIEKQKNGWVRQDLVWVSPEEKPQTTQGLWKCGDAWLPLEEAEKYHAQVGKWWKLRGEHFDVWSTASRKTALACVAQADGVYANLQRIFGRAPEGRPVLLVLDTADKYNAFATGDGRSSPDLRGLSSLYGAYFAELWLEPLERSVSGSGVAYWDASNDAGNLWGPIFVRSAAAQSFAEALDPSPKTLARVASGKAKAGELADSFWAEKKIPEWFRYGAAAYVERYFLHNEGGDPRSMVKWSVQNIVNKGGLDPLDKIFAFGVSLDDAQASSKLLNEVGLVVAFIVDGDFKPVVEKHAALKAAIAKGTGIDTACTALQQEIQKNEAKLREFAGL